MSPRCPPFFIRSSNIRCSWIAHGAPLDWALDGLPATCGEDEASALNWSHVVFHFAGKKVEKPGRAPFRKARKSAVRMKKNTKTHFLRGSGKIPGRCGATTNDEAVFFPSAFNPRPQGSKRRNLGRCQGQSTGEPEEISFDAFCEATGHDFSHWRTRTLRWSPDRISARSSSVSG